MKFLGETPVFSPVFVDDDGDIQTNPGYSILSAASLSNIMAMLNNVPLQMTRILLDEETFEDIIKFDKDVTVTCDELKTSNHR